MLGQTRKGGDSSVGSKPCSLPAFCWTKKNRAGPGALLKFLKQEPPPRDHRYIFLHWTRNALLVLGTVVAQVAHSGRGCQLGRCQGSVAPSPSAHRHLSKSSCGQINCVTQSGPFRPRAYSCVAGVFSVIGAFISLKSTPSSRKMSGAGFKDFFFPKPFRPPLDLTIQSDVIRVSLSAHTQYSNRTLHRRG